MNTHLKPAWAALTGVVLFAGSLVAQVNTISAKPGALNYVEGTVSINDKPVSSKELKTTFLNVNDTLTTREGKAEVLLTPGVFFRVGSDSEIRMVSPSLTQTQVELIRGEAMLEATGLVKDNNLQIVDHGSITSIKKNGLYRFTADNPPLVAVLDGKAQVVLNDGKVDLKKNRQTVLAAGNLKAEKFDKDKSSTDDLYAWSNVRSEYQAAASYRVSQSASLGALGYGSGMGSGWYWDNGFSSWAWLPGSGAFFSPFGYGFYSPAMVGYAPVVVSPLYGGTPYGWRGRPGGINTANGWHGNRPAPPAGTTPGATGVVSAPVPIRPSGWRGGAWNGNPGAWNGNAGAWQGGGAGANAGAWHGHPGGAAAGGNPGGWHGGAGAGNGGGMHPSFQGGGGHPGGGMGMGGGGPHGAGPTGGGGHASGPRGH